MISPKTKIELMRKYEVNPGAAFIAAIDALRGEIADIVHNRIDILTNANIIKFLKEHNVEAKVVKALESDPNFTKKLVGKTGPRGPQGEKPIPGKDYTVPKDGKDGKPGRDGENGRDGQTIVGPAGKDGENGSPDKPIEIADKLNTLFEKVDITVIRGLKTYLASMERSIREKKGSKSGGGGMSTPQHENFSTSSATTTISTNYRIAANGNALWLYYNGQLLMKGTHYTVGANQKTITFLITLEDSTNVSIIYFRT